MDTAKLTIIDNNKGFAIVYIALAIFALVGCLGLAIDLGHMYMVRGELQNAADASALAGAAVLYPNNGGVLTPNFFDAQAAATAFISQNNSDGVSLADGTIAYGYWNLSLKHLETPSTPPTSLQVPAVVATISRSPGNNGGPVPTFFARVFGSDQTSVSSSSNDNQRAVAVSGFPGYVPAASGAYRVFPMAISSCMTDQYFSQNPLPSPPTQIIIDYNHNPLNVYSPGGPNCQPGQWTSFRNDTNIVRPLLTTGNSTPLQTGDNIWIQQTVANTRRVYRDVNNYWHNSDVLMPIVETSSGNITTHNEMTIQGFATFHIESASVNWSLSTAIVTGYFIPYSRTYHGTRPGGSVSNTVTPPLMVQ